MLEGTKGQGHPGRGAVSLEGDNDLDTAWRLNLYDGAIVFILSS